MTYEDYVTVAKVHIDIVRNITDLLGGKDDPSLLTLYRHILEIANALKQYKEVHV
jgi:hypothetical protein